MLTAIVAVFSFMAGPNGTPIAQTRAASSTRVQQSAGPRPGWAVRQTRRQSDQDSQPGEADRPSGLVWDNRPSLRIGDLLRVDLTARFQGVFRWSYPGADVTADLTTFDMRRDRLGVDGALFDHIEFQIERDLTTEELTQVEIDEGLQAETPWKDVYVNVDYLTGFEIRAGRFKIPFSLDETTGAVEGDFVYRSLGADYLAPSRDTGVMVHDRFFDRGLSYRVGVFQHDGDNPRSKSIVGGDETLAARVSGTPLRPVLGRWGSLEIGTAFTASRLANESFEPNGLRGRTIVTEDTFFAPVYVSGTRRRWEADVEWMGGPTSARAEYTRVIDTRQDQGIGGQDLPDARYRAWYVSGTWIITGETKERPLRPQRSLFRGGPGAIEVTARYEHLWYDSVDGQAPPLRNPRAETILPNGDRALTLGVNWFLNRWIAVQFNGIREEIEDAERSPVPGGEPFWSQVLQVQFVL